MAASLGQAVLQLVGDSTQLNKDVDKAKSSVNKSLEKMGTSLQKAGGLMTVGLTTPLVASAKEMVDSASDLNETVSKVGVVFGDQAAKVIKFGDSAAQSLGMSKNEALSAAGTYGNLFRAMGMAESKSADMSTNLVKLAGDLASFNNADPSEVLEKLRAGLTGEAEPLKSLGININEATIKAKAMSMGLAKGSVDANKVAEAQLKVEKATLANATAIKKYGADSFQGRQATINLTKAQEALDEALAGDTSELDAASKAQAVYALMLEQTSLAQGDFERTSDGLANSQRILKAELSNAMSQLGTQLLPIVLQAVKALTGVLTMVTNLGPAGQSMILMIGGIVAAAGPVLTVVGTLMKVGTGIASLISGGAGLLAPVMAALGPVGIAIGVVIAVIGLLYAAWKNNWFGIRDVTANVINGIVNFWNNVFLPAIRKVADFVGNVLAGAFNGVKQAIIDVITWIGNLIERMTGLKLPDWMTPGSPTPWEIGLRGVGKAMGDLDSMFLPGLANALDSLPQSIGVSAASGGLMTQGSSRTVSNSFVINNPVGETSDESMSRALKRLQFLGAM